MTFDLSGFIYQNDETIAISASVKIKYQLTLQLQKEHNEIDGAKTNEVHNTRTNHNFYNELKSRREEKM